MKKVLILCLFTINIFASPELLLNSVTDDNISKKATKLILDLKDGSVNNIEHKTKIKENKKSLSSISKDIDLDLIRVKNNLIDIKQIIVKGFKNNESYKDTLFKLKAIDIDDFTKKYERDLALIKTSKRKKEVQKKLKNLKEKINEITLLNNDILEKYQNVANLEGTVVSKTKISVYLSVLNNELKVYNQYLKKVNLDIGRVIIFFSLLLLFILGGIIFNKILNFFLKKISKSEYDDLENNNLENNGFETIKKPMGFFFFLLGFQIGLEILIYPNILPIWLTLLFIVLNTINIVIIGNKLIDIILYIISHKKLIKLNRSEIINLISRGLKILFLIVATVFLLSKFGVDTTKIVASLGIGSLAIAFASKDMLAKFFSGVKLIIDDSFSIGDWVYFQFNGREGTIIDVGFMNTTIRTFDNALLVIPNSKISEGSYINWSRRKIGRKIGITLGVKYSSKKEDIKKALIDLREMLENHDGISPRNVNFDRKRMKDGKLVSIGDSLGLKNTLMVHLTKFADSGIEIDIYAFSKTVMWAEWRDVVEDIMFKIMEILEKNNLELAFPSQSIYLENNDSKLEGRP